MQQQMPTPSSEPGSSRASQDQLPTHADWSGGPAGNRGLPRSCPPPFNGRSALPPISGGSAGVAASVAAAQASPRGAPSITAALNRPRALLLHQAARQERLLPAELWGDMERLAAEQHLGKGGEYVQRGPPNAARQRALEQRRTHMQLDHYRFPTGRTAALEDWPLHRGLKQQTDHVAHALAWGGSPYADRLAALASGDRWLRAGFTQGRRHIEPPGSSDSKAAPLASGGSNGKNVGGGAGQGKPSRSGNKGNTSDTMRQVLMHL